MTQVSESPYQTEKYLHYHEMDEYLQDTEQDLINNDTNVLPNGLRRIREDRSNPNDVINSNANSNVIQHLDLRRFSTESLHSYSFVTNDASLYENRQNILRRSIDFMKNKIKGWRIPAMLSPVEPSPSQSIDIVLPSELTDDSESLPPRILDISSLYNSINASSLHSPTRFTPQNKAIITTDSQSNILCVNDIACLIFGYPRDELFSIKALDLVASPFREKQERSLASRLQNDDDVVLACGKVIPIKRKNEETSAASLWLKVKKDECGNTIFIWIFEEIVETMMITEIDNEGIIRKASGDVKALYGYSPEDLIGMRITTLIPALETIKSSHNDIVNNNMDIDEKLQLDIDKINKIKFYGSRSKNGGNFPIIGKISLQSIQEESCDDQTQCMLYRLKIISIPTIAGVITAHKTGIIQSCNSEFVKYLFGVAAHELIGKRHIETLLPQFPQLIGYLATEKALVEGIVINEYSFRRAAAFISSLVVCTHGKDFSNASISGQGPSGIIAVHRDGTEFDVDIQMRVIESPDEPLHALWITYDRNVNFGKEQPSDDNGIFPIHEEKEEYLDHYVSENFKISKQEDRKENEEEGEKFPLSKFIAAGGKPPPLKQISPDNRRISTPPSISPAPEPFDPMLYSAITLTKNINDFVILDNMGSGAYGQVNLAYNKKDTEKKKVVLKFVDKSRILMDCWTRDKSLGTIPLEIHILHTLRRLPHLNIVQMVDYFEDDNYYYIEMGLHGVGMDLFDYIELNTTMPEAEIKSIFRQVARAIQHLHQNKIVHRDIKDENVILDEDGNVQLIDFGSSAYIKNGRKFDTFCGTIDYAAPEVLTGKKYSGPPQDIWALGILLYTLIYKENPFYNIDEIIARDLRIPYILSEGSIDLVKRMLDRDVEQRPTIDDVLNHSWLRED
ncbi:kinase-like domain-containing protein [Glomus cerebriforme]|uniref:non-specific serine/threonine protein kinase n=1 Tax=Glomus cerebriforme TaxID=658196 RepID=A0A397TPA6_9GLOM|nr:kinase-like domain-containing protein [Glomus cerebriforme]